jgi:hypothetical protein
MTKLRLLPNKTIYLSNGKETIKISLYNDPLYQHYPRLYAVASIYGFEYEDIKKYMDIVKNSHYSDLVKINYEVAFKALLVRLGVQKEQFEQKITELIFNCKTLDQMRAEVGLQQMALVFALYYKR